jgi:hypothetical protein
LARGVFEQVNLRHRVWINQVACDDVFAGSEVVT